MKITIITAGSRGDIQPYLALGLGLKAVGHEVRLATHVEFKTAICQQGLKFAPLAGNPRSILESEAGQAWLETRRNPIRFVSQMKPVLSPLVEQGFSDMWNACQEAEAILFAPLAFPAQSIAQKLGVPAFAAYLQPISPTSSIQALGFPAPSGWLTPGIKRLYNRFTYRLLEQLFWQLFRPMVNKWRQEKLELAPLPFFGPYRKLRQEKFPFLYGFSEQVIPRPADWAEWLHITGYWFLDRPTDWQPPADLVAFLAAGPPPIYLGFGSMKDRHPQELTELVLEAIKLSGQRAIISMGWGGLLETKLPPEVFKIGEIPHDWLFPQMAAVVHHGGVGTTAAGLRAGVPSIVVPFFADQPFWGERVFKLGAGPKPILRKHLTSANLAEAIKTAVESEAIQSRAVKLGELIRRENGVQSAVEILGQYFNQPTAVEIKAR